MTGGAKLQRHDGVPQVSLGLRADLFDTGVCQVRDALLSRYHSQDCLNHLISRWVQLQHFEFLMALDILRIEHPVEKGI